MDSIEYSSLILALQMIKGVGPKTARQILIQFKGEDLQKSDWLIRCHSSVIHKKVINGDLTGADWLKAKEVAKESIKKSLDAGITVINFKDAAYPKNMSYLNNFPLILYVKGNLDLLNQKSVGFIGTRRPTKIGEMMSRRMAKKFAEDGYVIVSGLSVGTNTAAHLGALDVNDGKTIAILGESLEQPIYPKENTKLADEILSRGGALVSTFRYGTMVKRQFLAARDEWESGMSDGLVVVETDQNGKTEMALQHALKQHRKVGMLDHTQCAKITDVTKIEEAINNQKFIKLGRALPLWSEDSLMNFEQQIDRARKKRLSDKSILFNQKGNNQINLF
ncbi:MAG: DNA-processing protein DprA [Firmicutes bacterium]|uniref:DNA-processing protein DprA n=1 Tax=Candidatus Gallilactobacillus intestinavium TaxID=2840838 RepID=A0A9D9H4S7_9LACO|nr:DNA-processing protein DprA [Candidatus Gallilactobacillus intestinavium]